MKNDIKDNKIELLKEDLECVHMYLDDLQIPKHDGVGTLSIVGRIKFAQELGVLIFNPKQKNYN